MRPDAKRSRPGWNRSWAGSSPRIRPASGSGSPVGAPGRSSSARSILHAGASSSFDGARSTAEPSTAPNTPSTKAQSSSSFAKCAA